MSFPRNKIRGVINKERLRRQLMEDAEPDKLIIQPKTTLHYYAWKNEANLDETKHFLQTVGELIERGKDVNEENDYFFTPLIFAVIACKWKMVELLLEKDADVNHITYDGKTALHYAVRNHTILGSKRIFGWRAMRVVKALLKSQPKMDVKDKWGHTPLIIAIIYHDFQMVHELLRHNASVNFQDNNQNSALHHALQLAEVDVNIVLELVRHGSNIFIRNRDGQTPLDVFISHLLNSSSDETKKATFVFKLYIFLGNPIFTNQRRLIDTISKEKNCQLSECLVHCLKETRRTRRDKIATNYYMYNMALRGLSSIYIERNHVQFNIFDKVLDKLLKGKYPIYYDLILSGICRPYLNKKFAEICSSVGNTCLTFLDFEVLFSLSLYLSHVDMFHMIVAYSSGTKYCNSVTAI